MEKYLIAWVPFCVGGIGDLLLGLVTSYCISKLTKRKFVIQLDDYPDLSSVVKFKSCYLKTDSHKPECVIRYNNKDIQRYLYTFDPSDWENKNVMIWSNQNLLQYFISNPLVDDMGLVLDEKLYSNFIRDNTQEFFENVLEFTDEIILPDLSNVIGIHIRTNDDQLLNSNQSVKYVSFIEDQFLTYKTHIENTTSIRSVFIASDNHLAEKIADSIFIGYKVIVNDGPIVSTRHNYSGKLEGYKRAFYDMISLGRCRRIYLRLNTNFSRLGAMLNPYGDVYINDNGKITKDLIRLFNHFSTGTYVKGKLQHMKILVCTNAIRKEFRNIVKYGLRSMTEYCKKHNYELLIHTEQDDNSVYDGRRDYPWYKIKLLSRLIKERNDLDYIIWIDADTVVMNDNILLEEIIMKHVKKEKCITLPREQKPPHVANTGFIIVKPCEKSSKIMNMIWNNNPKNFDPAFHEQSSINDLHKRNVENIKNNVQFVDPQHQKDFFSYWYMYKKDNVFIMHIARCGHDKEGFIFTMDLFYKGRIDEESDEQYKRRMKWLNTDEGYRAITCWRQGLPFPRYLSARNSP